MMFLFSSPHCLVCLNPFDDLASPVDSRLVRWVDQPLKLQSGTTVALSVMADGGTGRNSQCMRKSTRTVNRELAMFSMMWKLVGQGSVCGSKCFQELMRAEHVVFEGSGFLSLRFFSLVFAKEPSKVAPHTGHSVACFACSRLCESFMSYSITSHTTVCPTPST